ncbi:MAG: lipopolysaccharide heptosyltransferase II [Lentisphaerae bacterium]|nr:lipopolysaccharide heptosyltransferase II [Lentisphaerota bacterium]
MPVSPESVSNEPSGVLVMGANWLGDAIMAMPALQAYRRLFPTARLVLLAKNRLAALWAMQPALSGVLSLPLEGAGLVRAVRRVKALRFQKAAVFPRSFRSALVPFLARVPERVGLPGHARDWMLTRVVEPEEAPDRRHQAHEYFHVLDLPVALLEPPRLAIPPETVDRVRSRWAPAGGRVIGVIPGAARGPAKRWPAEYFAKAGRQLRDAEGCRVLVFGTAGERALCLRVTEAIGSGALNLAGETTLPELAAALSLCAVVIANDSGGTHLAAAVGAPVVAVFGVTDPEKTRPLGEPVVIRQNSMARNRDVRRASALAEEALRRIAPEQVVAAARSCARKQ